MHDVVATSPKKMSGFCCCAESAKRMHKTVENWATRSQELLNFHQVRKLFDSKNFTKGFSAPFFGGEMRHPLWNQLLGNLEPKPLIENTQRLDQKKRSWMVSSRSGSSPNFLVGTLSLKLHPKEKLNGFFGPQKEGWESGPKFGSSPKKPRISICKIRSFFGGCNNLN